MQSTNSGRSNPGLRELSAAETKQVGGGIIIVGGSILAPIQSPLAGSKWSWVALNPQPLPPRY